MKDMIILKKAREEEMLSEDNANMTSPVEIVRVSSFVDFARRYNWVISNANLDTIKKLGLTDIKKY